MSQTTAELEQQLQEANENLQTECRRNAVLMLRLANLMEVSNRLSTDLQAICEAYLVGDTETALAGINKFATAYQRNTQGAVAERRVH